VNVLAIGAHPDDIEIGCGGTLLKLKQQGHKVYMLVMTRGESGGCPEKRLQEQEAAAEYIGAEEIFWGMRRTRTSP